jgi:hypothetical protein
MKKKDNLVLSFSMSLNLSEKCCFYSFYIFIHIEVKTVLCTVKGNLIFSPFTEFIISPVCSLSKASLTRDKRDGDWCTGTDVIISHLFCSSLIAGLTRDKGDGDWCTGRDVIISYLSDLYQRLALVKIKETDWCTSRKVIISNLSALYQKLSLS